MGAADALINAAHAVISSASPDDVRRHSVSFTAELNTARRQFETALAACPSMRATALRYVADTIRSDRDFPATTDQVPSLRALRTLLNP